MSARLDTLAEGLASILSEREREILGALLASDLCEAAVNALKHIEKLEETLDPSAVSWTEEHAALEFALEVSRNHR